MNYFELFEISVQLWVDKNSLTKKYFELSKKYHRDYFCKCRDEEQTDALEKSARLNKALKTLQNPDEAIVCFTIKRSFRRRRKIPATTCL